MAFKDVDSVIMFKRIFFKKNEIKSCVSNPFALSSSFSINLKTIIIIVNMMSRMTSKTKKKEKNKSVTRKEGIWKIDEMANTSKQAKSPKVFKEASKIKKYL